MASYRRPLPTFTLALSSLPKQDPFDDQRDFQREIFSGYYASLAVPRDFLSNCDPKFLPSNVFILIDDQDERFPLHSDTGCVTGWWRRIVQMMSYKLFRRRIQ